MMESLNNMPERISIITPVYNKADYIAQTLKSIDAQTLRDWDLILVDDCSSDESRQVISDYFSALAGCVMEEEEVSLPGREESFTSWRLSGGATAMLITLPKNIGAAASRNMGLKYAKGRYLAYLDSDDLWMPEKLARQLAFLREKHAAFSFTSYEFGDADAKGTGRIVKAPETLSYTQALSRTVIFTSTVMFDMEKLPKDKLRMPRISSEDTATWWTILKTGVTAYGLQENLTIYRRPKGGSLSSNKLHAIHRIWDLYRKREGMSVPRSFRYFVPWAFRATLRRMG